VNGLLYAQAVMPRKSAHGQQTISPPHKMAARFNIHADHDYNPLAPRFVAGALLVMLGVVMVSLQK
jgi:hypothetical protein